MLAALGALPASPAAAIVGGRPAGGDVAASTVMVVSTRGASCTGVVLGPSVILTAAHCVAPKANYAVAVIEPAGPRVLTASRVSVHPGFDPASFDTRRPTPDLALMQLSEPLPDRFRPATLASDPALPARGSLFTLVGFGVVKDGDGRSAGTLRAVDLPVIGTTGGIMIRLSAGAAAGGCTGDSGGPVLAGGTVAAIIGWSTAAGGARGCGGVTGATLIGPQRPWIESTARAMGATLR
ncbi:trypsin-like serine protease [Ancylobacter sp. 6x-1]|uniref:Trypsin-like serine protease n=1 Tax=Ancylobacter crimeensis TaxID=2579147 RepID=A0ABT0D974_9HYPH|nr:trypsin-like serine protease [Ancylobacter crimeensis]MCK0196352.1 trypsin-like serine protease [Ancylobacter crimeensis]